MSGRAIFGIAACVLAAACGGEGPSVDDALAIELNDTIARRITAMSPLPPVPPDPTNRVADDPAAARFGQALFYDPRLSANGEVSCATCHDPERGFTDGRTLAMGLSEGRRHTPTLWNVAHHRWLTWDGRADSLWMQALDPIEDPTEMGSTRADVVALVANDPELRAAYEDVFGALDASDVDGTYVDLGKAIAAYQRRLVRGDAPFDVFVEGVRESDATKLAALSPAAQRGLELFLGKANCVLCHSGPNFSDGEFHNNALPTLHGGEARDAGRYDGAQVVAESAFNAAGPHSDEPDGPAAARVRRLRQSSETWGEFRTPSLRNLANRAPFMHQGQLEDLDAVLEFYSELVGSTGRGHHQEQILVPLRLEEVEKADLKAFLASLEGGPPAPELLGPPPSARLEPAQDARRGSAANR